MEELKQPIVFAFLKDNKLQVFRADTFNTITQDFAKIYHYSPSQVEIVLNNVRNGCNNMGTNLMKFLAGKENIQFANGDKNDAIDHLSATEKKMRRWGEFEVRVHPFIGYEEDYTYPEKWKIQAEIANLQDAIEIHKFKVIDNEN